MWKMFLLDVIKKSENLWPLDWKIIYYETLYVYLYNLIVCLNVTMNQQR